jgi:hypothetical protein
MTGISDGSSSLYHECSVENLKQIRADGLESESKEQVSQICLDEGDFRLPETTELENAQGYAHRLVTTLLERNRPEQFPKRYPAVWAFGHWNGESQMCRQAVVVLDGEAVLEDHSLFAADFSIAEKAYLKTMQEFKLRYATSASRLKHLCKKYWESATEITDLTKNSVENVEIYIPADKVPAKHIASCRVLKNGEWLDADECSLSNM